MNAPHVPVLLNEVLEALATQDGEVFVDGTFGAGGYSRAILGAANCTLYGIDRDGSAQKAASLVGGEFAERFIFVKGCFGDAVSLLPPELHGTLDGFVLDIGVSSMQIDEAERGFSFRFDGALDMRMDQDSGAISAADMVNTYDVDRLADIIRFYGEERHAGRVARAIVARRDEELFATTSDLANVVRSVVHKSPKDPTDQATRTFQALRIAVNDELGELARGLAAAQALLKPGGRLVVVSFHSLEDKIVKNFLKLGAGLSETVSRHLPENPAARPAPTFRLPSKKAIFPTESEISQNPRSRSARMRVGIRTDAPDRPVPDNYHDILIKRARVIA